MGRLLPTAPAWPPPGSPLLSPARLLPPHPTAPAFTPPAAPLTPLTLPPHAFFLAGFMLDAPRAFNQRIFALLATKLGVPEADLPAPTFGEESKKLSEAETTALADAEAKRVIREMEAEAEAAKTAEVRRRRPGKRGFRKAGI